MGIDVSKLGNVGTIDSVKSNNTASFRANMEQQPDTVEISPEAAESKPPKISRLRLALGLLSKNQAKQINQSGQLPPNAKFVKLENGKYTIKNNFFSLREGTPILPEGYEVKRTLLGFARVVPVGTTGFFLRNE